MKADPVSNPLGLFYASGDVTLDNNATLKGTLIGANHITITGANVTIAPVDLMPLQGTSTTIRPPTLLSSNDIIVSDTGSPTIDGLLTTFDKFNLKICPQAKALAMHGNVAARRFIMEGRNEFNVAAFWWSLLYTGFNSQSKIPYFPVYLSGFGMQADPNVVFQPPSNPVTYIWPTNGFIVYIADPTDGGLRWELVDWRDLR